VIHFLTLAGFDAINFAVFDWAGRRRPPGMSGWSGFQPCKLEAAQEPIGRITANGARSHVARGSSGGNEVVCLN